MKKLIVAGAFLIKDNKLLLSLRKNTKTEDGFYSLVGGKIDNGEAIHEGLIREIKEETGIIVYPDNMKLMHVTYFTKEDETEIISFDFLIKKWQGEPINKEPHKHEKLEWFSLDNLPENIIKRHEKAYQFYLKNIYYSYYKI